jgi:hypothetical protein
MGTKNLISFFCVRERFARNLLLLSNTNRIVSDTYLTSSGFHLSSMHTRVLGTYSLITSVKNNNNRNKNMTRLSSIFSQQTFGYSTVEQNKIHPISP